MSTTQTHLVRSMRCAVVLALMTVLAAPACSTTFLYWDNHYSQDPSPTHLQLLRNTSEDPDPFAEVVAGARGSDPEVAVNGLCHAHWPVSDSRSGYVFVVGKAPLSEGGVVGIYRLSVDEPAPRLIASKAGISPRAIDPERRLLYFVAGSSGPNRIWRIDYDGTGEAENLGLPPAGYDYRSIAAVLLERGSQTLYWITMEADGAHALWRVDLDGTRPYVPQRVFAPRWLDDAGRPVDDVRAAVVVPESREILWISRYRVMSTKLETGKTKCICEPTVPSSYRTGLAFDASRGWVYWTDLNDNTVRRAKLDGSEMSAVLTKEHGTVDEKSAGLDPNPMGLALVVVYDWYVPWFLRAYPD